MTGKISSEVMKKLPKAELHCHLDGSVRVETILELAQEQRITLPASTVSTLTPLVRVSMDCESLSEYLESFAITLKVLQKPYAITRCMYEVAEDAAEDGVRYLEVRFSPILHISEGMSLSAVMEAVCEGRSLAELKLGIFVRIVVCGLRHLDPSVSENLAEIAWRYRDRGVVAFDLAGPETGFSSEKHKSAFDIIRRHHTNCTIHAGEEIKAGWQSIWDSIRHCGAHRIGHGVQLKANDRLKKFVIDQGIAVEACVTSNMQTKAIKEARDHPMREFFDAGVKLVPCTDNVTVSGITLTHEYELIQNELGFEPWEILTLMDNGFSSAFLDYAERRRLRADCFHDALRLFLEAGIDVDSIVPRFEDSIALGDLSVVVKDAKAGGPRPYWQGVPLPDITEEIVRALPKADVHCRLDSSLSPEHVSRELGMLEEADLRSALEAAKVVAPGADLTPGDYSAERVRSVFRNSARRSDAKEILAAVSRSRKQIASAVEDVLSQSIADGITYCELMVRPWVHAIFRNIDNCLNHSMSGKEDKFEVPLEEIVAIACDTAKAFSARNENKIEVGIVVYVSHPEDDPLRFNKAAQIAIDLRERGVVGMGIYGQDIPEGDMHYFEQTFALLKANHIPVAFSAGTDCGDQLTAALHTGGAVRIGKAFVAVDDSNVLNHLINHRIPVEVGVTDLLEERLGVTRSFAGHPLRLFIDRKLAITVCSLERSFAKISLPESIRMLAEECSLSISDLIELIANGSNAGFRCMKDRKASRANLLKASKNVFEGFDLLWKVFYDPVRHNGHYSQME